MDAIPIIDIGDFETGGFERCADEIARAARTIGFFYLVNHSVPRELMAATFAQSKAFFAKPFAEKMEIAIAKVGGNRGYSALRNESLNPERGEDVKEAFNIGLEFSPDDPEIVEKKPFRTLNAWPNQSGFRETMLGYFDACTDLAMRLHKAFARDLGLQLDFFADKIDKPLATLRFLHYPTTPPGEIGAGEHTDYGNVTLLATDDVGGLEVRTRAGEWVAAPPLEDAFVVNIGDCLMRWTNDVYVSNPHRVVNASGRERYSIAYFFDPNPEAIVETIPSCLAPGEISKYPPISTADYLRSRFEATYLKG
jgi:isopenicillin N synthase-like dioxygenase